MHFNWKNANMKIQFQPHFLESFTKDLIIRLAVQV